MDRLERRSESGYSLVILVVAVTVLSIMTAAALPLWSNAIQREKEEELISRGLQYVEAIRVFQLRFGRPPVRLEELLETKPRCIRRLWKDPMVEDGKWGIIFQNQNPNLQPQQIGDGQLPPDPNCPNCPRPANPGPGGGAPGGDDNDPGALPGKGDTVAVGPITGVYSKSRKKSILVFNGRERYDEWHFTIELVNLSGPPRIEAAGGGAAVPLPPAEGGTPVRSLRWIGRPFPPFLDPMQSGTMPNGQPPGTKPGFNVPRPEQKSPKG